MSHPKPWCRRVSLNPLLECGAQGTNRPLWVATIRWHGLSHAAAVATSPAATLATPRAKPLAIPRFAAPAA